MKGIFYKIKRLLKIFKLGKYFQYFDLYDYYPNSIFLSFKTFYEDGGIEMIDWNCGECHQKVKKEMDEIYKYITYYRPIYEKLLKKISYSEYFNIKTYEFVENRFYYRDEEMIIKIIKIRNYLWV